MGAIQWYDAIAQGIAVLAIIALVLAFAISYIRSKRHHD